MSSRLELVTAGPSDAPALARLMQLYAYDFSEFSGWELSESGLFPVGQALDLAPWRQTSLLRANGSLAGFAIVDGRSFLTGASDVHDVAEFFVLRRHRRQGLGAVAAKRLFALHPGRWEVRQTAQNIAATAFWRRVIGAFTGGRFTETTVDSARWRGPVQTFDTLR